MVLKDIVCMCACALAWSFFHEFLTKIVPLTEWNYFLVVQYTTSTVNVKNRENWPWMRFQTDSYSSSPFSMLWGRFDRKMGLYYIMLYSFHCSPLLSFYSLTFQAGSKNLLLHSLLKKSEDTKKTEYLKEEKPQKPREVDRQRVIEAYRELKRKRPHNPLSIDLWTVFLFLKMYRLDCLR